MEEFRRLAKEEVLITHRADSTSLRRLISFCNTIIDIIKNATPANLGEIEGCLLDVGREISGMSFVGGSVFFSNQNFLPWKQLRFISLLTIHQLKQQNLRGSQNKDQILSEFRKLKQGFVELDAVLKNYIQYHAPYAENVRKLEAFQKSELFTFQDGFFSFARTYFLFEEIETKIRTILAFLAVLPKQENIWSGMLPIMELHQKIIKNLISEKVVKHQLEVPNALFQEERLAPFFKGLLQFFEVTKKNVEKLMRIELTANGKENILHEYQVCADWIRAETLGFRINFGRFFVQALKSYRQDRNNSREVPTTEWLLDGEEQVLADLENLFEYVSFEAVRVAYEQDKKIVSDAIKENARLSSEQASEDPGNSVSSEDPSLEKSLLQKGPALKLPKAKKPLPKLYFIERLFYLFYPRMAMEKAFDVVTEICRALDVFLKPKLAELRKLTLELILDGLAILGELYIPLSSWDQVPHELKRGFLVFKNIRDKFYHIKDTSVEQHSFKYLLKKIEKDFKKTEEDNVSKPPWRLLILNGVLRDLLLHKFFLNRKLFHQDITFTADGAKSLEYASLIALSQLLSGKISYDKLLSQWDKRMNNLSAFQKDNSIDRLSVLLLYTKEFGQAVRFLPDHQRVSEAKVENDGELEEFFKLLQSRSEKTPLQQLGIFSDLRRLRGNLAHNPLEPLDENHTLGIIRESAKKPS